jgi:glucose-1-phosphate adenylyltransferase
MWLFDEACAGGVEDFLILSGDHLYRMDYSLFVKAHRAAGADITVAALPCIEEEATAFGLMKIDGSGRIVEFAEKPSGAALQAMRVDTTVLGLSPAAAKAKPYIASMGIYVCKASALKELLMERFKEEHDFGSDIIPGAKDAGMAVQAHLFDGYWEDIGTIEAFFEANLALTKSPPKFEFAHPDGPIYTSPRFLPPAKIVGARLKDAIVSHGAYLHQCEVSNAIIGLRSRIAEGAVIEDALVMGADYYESDEQRAALAAAGGVPIGVGARSRLRRCIIDKNARIGEDCRIMNEAGVQEAQREEDGIYIRSGIVTVLRNFTIKSGTVI